MMQPQGQHAHFAFFPEAVLCLTREVDSCFIAETESLIILTELACTEHLTDLNKCRVTWVWNYLNKVLCSVTWYIWTMNCFALNEIEPVQVNDVFSFTRFSSRAADATHILNTEPGIYVSATALFLHILLRAALSASACFFLELIWFSSYPLPKAHKDC